MSKHFSLLHHSLSLIRISPIVFKFVIFHLTSRGACKYLLAMRCLLISLLHALQVYISPYLIKHLCFLLWLPRMVYGFFN